MNNQPNFQRQLDWYLPQLEKLKKLNVLRAEIARLTLEERAFVLARELSE